MNEIEHIEIPTSDIKGSMEFYSAAFGWKCREVEGMNYGFFNPEGGPAGGFDPTAMPGSGITPYIHVEDIEATLVKIENLGGSVVTPKTAIGGDMGFFALFHDPQGNRLGLWSKT
ncbi:MAG: VOC family protein [bacterium]|jgi:hypothetical protein